MVLSGSGTSITLNDVGESVHLLAIDDGSGGAVWFVVGGNGYTIV